MAGALGSDNGGLGRRRQGRSDWGWSARARLGPLRRSAGGGARAFVVGDAACRVRELEERKVS